MEEDKELLLIDGVWWSSIEYYEEVKNTLSTFERESVKKLMFKQL